MTLWIGNKEVAELYKGNKLVKQLYRGSELIYKNSIWPAGTVVFESSTPGTYSFTLTDRGIYEIIAVGGGGGASQYYRSNRVYYSATGGSGGYGLINAFMKRNSIISITVGNLGTDAPTTSTKQVWGGTGGASSISYNSENLLTANAGTGGGTKGSNTTVGSGGGVVIGTYSQISYSTFTNGNNGNKGTSNQTPAGGVSVYNGHGNGSGIAGANAFSGGTVGYVKITKL